MVEGGQRVISSFLSASPVLVDILIITIAPILVGQAGVEALSPDSKVFALVLI
jgi:2,5-diamino-6-(ribosylamino)-4(3H)-pyrimidinone 5'-phosphate reductase